ncbi:MAG: PhzF family phenazine biosynthesis protein [Vicinamibacterales bacterium]
MRYFTYDVFTDRPFEGNQLAVFPDAQGLAVEQMRALTREMNYSESTFILPKEAPDTDIRMRIFTPGAELPMAGHPTIGSTFALADSGVIANGREQFVFGLGVGPTKVELTWANGALSFAWMDQRLPEFREPASPLADIIRAAGLDPAAVDQTKLPVEEISCGNPFIFVPVATRTAADAAEPDASVMKRIRSAFPGGHVGLFIFSMEPVEKGVTAYARMFAHGHGIAEDPATGSANGPLGCYLVKHQLAPANGDMICRQGVAMGRPSSLHIRITRSSPSAITRVQVGGKAVRVAEGNIVAKL